MSEPIIGLTCGLDYEAETCWLRYYYQEVVADIGGVPLILPPMANDAIREKMFNLVDAVIFTGGNDVDPHFFGQLPQVGIGKIDPARDSWEIWLAKTCWQAKKPMLGICRGMQVMNICLGGTIYQDIHRQRENTMEHMQKAPKWYNSHSINVTNPMLAEIIGGERRWVNSFHHQAIDKVADDFEVAATAPDGVVEAIVGKNHPFAIGVQWHPECAWQQQDMSYGLFESLVKAADRK